jgi:hypothetical protein
MSLADQDGASIKDGIKLVTSYPLLLGLLDSRRPTGGLFVLDTTQSGLDPGFSDLGVAFQLVYFAASELP